MPNCGEPWLEALYEDPSLGRIELLASPLVKLTNKKEATITDLGAPDAVIERIGSFLTGGMYMYREIYIV